MNKKLAIIAALAIVGVVAAVLVFSSDVEESEFAFRIFRFRQNKNLTKLYSAWKKKYNKTYGGAEHDARYKIFVEAYHKVQRINSNKKNTFTVGMNKFADLSKGEFSSLYLGLKRKNVTKRNVTKKAPRLDDAVEIEDLRFKRVGDGDIVNWVNKGAVTPVKNQQQCGSCWAFSTTGSLEGLNFIQNGKLLSFSEQQLVDCSTSYGNEGCDGGLMEDALSYTADQGIMLEDAYPYTAEDGSCQYDSKQIQFKNVGQEPANSDADLEAAVNLGPVSVSVEADQDCFQYYTGGVLNDDSCGTSLDHGVLAVGYGTSDGTGYWIVKNSWGADWGNNGYLQIARQADGDGICGINQDNVRPTA